MKYCDPPYDDLKDMDPPDTRVDSKDCLECETDPILKELKAAIVADPDLAPKQPTHATENNGDSVGEDDDPIKALEKAMAENPGLFTDEPKTYVQKELDPLEELAQYLKEHPEHTEVVPMGQHRDPNSQKVY